MMKVGLLCVYALLQTQVQGATSHACFNAGTTEELNLLEVGWYPVQVLVDVSFHFSLLLLEHLLVNHSPD